jgi:hypothetical protein
MTGSCDYNTSCSLVLSYSAPTAVLKRLVFVDGEDELAESEEPWPSRQAAR